MIPEIKIHKLDFTGYTKQYIHRKQARGLLNYGVTGRWYLVNHYMGVKYTGESEMFIEIWIEVKIERVLPERFFGPKYETYKTFVSENEIILKPRKEKSRIFNCGNDT